MNPWASFHERPSISLPPTTIDDWPETEASEGYNAEQPWRLKKYNPGFDSDKFDKKFDKKIQDFNLPHALVYALAIHEQLERFADRRQTQFRGRPNRDGSNTEEVLYADPRTGAPLHTNGSPDLSFMWLLYCHYLSALHREGQLTRLESGSWAYDPLIELRGMMVSFPLNLEKAERDRLRGGSRNNRLVPGFEWIHLLGEHLTELVCSLQAILTWCREEKKRRPRRYLRQPLQRLPPIVRLLLILKGRELAFEDALGNEHFEDVLIDKRLYMIDPLTFYNCGPDFGRPKRRWISCVNNSVKPELAIFRKQLQDRFDYRLLVDWGYGRLWKKLYLLLRPTTPAEKDAITSVSNFMQQHSRLAWNLYAVYPIDMDDIRADPCSVCLCDYEADDIVAELHCNHHFHPACLFSYWDDENRFQNRCPECRVSQGVLRDKVEIIAERTDQCYESNPGLQQLEEVQRIAALERYENDEDLSDEPLSMDLICRSIVLPALKRARIQKQRTVSGWNDMK